MQKELIDRLVKEAGLTEEQAKKAEAAGNAAKAMVAREAAEARKTWLAEAQKGLSDFKQS